VPAEAKDADMQEEDTAAEEVAGHVQDLGGRTQHARHLKETPPT
jgi:hypothetical protein